MGSDSDRVIVCVCGAADFGAAVPECGYLGTGHGGVAGLHQLVCILPHLVSTNRALVIAHPEID